MSEVGIEKDPGLIQDDAGADPSVHVESVEPKTLIRPDFVKETRRDLHPRHVQLMAISGAIGTGLFVGSGSALKRAGPLGLLLGYSIYGVLVLSSYNAMGEMVSWLPLDGAHLQFATRFVDPCFGFALAWLNVYNYATGIASEATAVAGLINYWNDSISNGVWCAIFLASGLLLNVFGVRVFGEGEFYFSMLKVLLIFMLFFFTFITMVGGNPQHDAFGFRYWRDPGPMAEYIGTGGWGRFLGLWSTFVQAAYAYGGPDFISMSAGETKYPRRILPSLFRRVIYRLLIFYVGGVFCVGILVAYNDPELGKSAKGAGASPFVLAAVRMGIPVLPSFINAMVLTSAWSAGTYGCFTASRILYTLAINRHAPRIFLKTYRGVPIVALGCVMALGCLCFMSLSNSAAVAFNWLTSLVGSLWIFNLALQHIIYIRFRAGLSMLGVDRSTLPFYRRHQLVYSWICVVAYLVIFLTNSFSVFTSGNWSYETFILSYLTLPLFLVLLFGHKVYTVCFKGGSWRFLRPEEMDLTTGKAEVDEDELSYPPVGASFGARLSRRVWG